MKSWLFREASYKRIIQMLIDESPSPRGMISTIADAIGCQRSYFSQMLHSKVNLNKDQAFGVCRFFRLGANETRYIHLLIDLEKASSPAYCKHLQGELSELRRQSELLAPRFSESATFDEPQSRFYYASWIPSAVHILTSITEFTNVQSVAERLQISESLVSKVLLQLESAELIERRGGNWLFAKGASFVPRDSPFVTQHHKNWRDIACEDSQSPASDGLHYTMVQTMTQRDWEKIKGLIVELIEKTRAIAAPSKPEVMATVNIDCFLPKYD